MTVFCKHIQSEEEVLTNNSAGWNTNKNNFKTSIKTVTSFKEKQSGLKANSVQTLLKFYGFYKNTILRLTCSICTVEVCFQTFSAVLNNLTPKVRRKLKEIRLLEETWKWSYYQNLAYGKSQWLS